MFRRLAFSRVRAAFALSLGLSAVTAGTAAPARAHGTVIDPPSRNYGCWLRWGSNFQSPQMASEDPMCAQAWQADATAMWNWNGLYREGVAGQHERAIRDGQLCSAGRTGGDRYAALDNPGPWKATKVGRDFTVTLHDQARHGADYIKVYVTKQGFDALNDPLSWDDLELVTETKKIAPGVGKSSTAPSLSGTSIEVKARAQGRSGRHIVYTIWQASHSDQSYYLCSDVTF